MHPIFITQQIMYYTEASALVYIIVGATGGIGSEVARRMFANGARLLIAARNEQRLARLAIELQAQSFVLDATQFGAVEECFNRALERYGRVDGIVNCVGSLLLKPAHLTSEIEWISTVAANLTSAFAVVRAATKSMKTGGSIVLISSAAARIGLANHEAIAAAKAGVAGLTLSAAATYASRNIRVNCVAPGLVQTPLTERITVNETALKASTAMHALGRIGNPADIALAIEWLLNPANSWMTGQVIGVDGGLGTLRPR